MSSPEVDAAVGEAPGNLTARAAELRATIAAPSPEKAAASRELVEVEAAMAEQERVGAKSRLTKLLRARGGRVSAYADDLTRIRELVTALTAACEQVNARFADLVRDELEVRALCRDFQLPEPGFTDLKSAERIVAPADLLKNLAEPVILTNSTARVRIERAWTKQRGGAA